MNTRPLNVLYFDGSGAAKMPNGSMDTQDIVAWRKVMPERFFDERQRLEDLCNWGVPLGLDGFLRMELDLSVLKECEAGLMIDFFLPAKSCFAISPLVSRSHRF